MKHLIVFILGIFIFQSALFGQTRQPKPAVKDEMSSEAFLKMVDETLMAFYAEHANSNKFDSIIDALEYEPNQTPDFSDEIYCERLKKINEQSSFKLDCNPTSLSVIRFFAKNRRSFAKIVMGRSALYFDLYEQTLAKYDMPIELKYLSVIESGLRPQVKSPAGALGLWQFMYGTGKMYGLIENSYIDERMDPVKSTDAACRFLKKLYDIYGDWNLALAAYNAGPGNVNKAIRRSGGKTTYWEVRPFLPRETQGYVPNFIAATYLLTYHAEHNIVPAVAKLHYKQLDTMCLKQGVHMETIAKLIDWSVEDIQVVNPIYKKTYIPQTSPNQCITGPLPKIGMLVSMEDSLYALERSINSTTNPTQIIKTPDIDDTETESNTIVSNEKVIYHKVKSGETMTKIATKYGVTNTQILKWNNLRSTRVNVGKRLKIIQNYAIKPTEIATKTSTTPEFELGTIEYDTVVVINHVVARNESLTVIASKYSVTADELKKWNNLTSNWLNIGQILKINATVKLTKQGLVKKTKVEEKIVEKPVEKAPIKKYYTIKSGDLFNRIAQKHGLTQAQLQKLNPGINPEKIKVGQVIRIN